MISYIASLDSVLQDHLDKSKVAKNTSKTIQNELLDCMYQVYLDEVKSETEKANYVSVQADEMTDISCRSQFVIILRYMINSHVVERFLSFVEIENRTADGLASVLKDELEMFGLQKKLVAQTYDGAAVMSGSRGGVQIRMKEHFPHAQYVHCYAHQLNLVLKKVCSTIKRVRIFFANISGIGSFLTVSPKRSCLLRDICRKRVPTVSETRWNYQSRITNCVSENKSELLECFDRIRNESGWDDKSIWEATGFVKLLQDEEFLFFLSFFSHIFQHVDILYNTLQSRKSTSVDCNQALKKFETAVNYVRRNTKHNDHNGGDECQPLRKRAKVDCSMVENDAKEACDIIVNQVRDRFEKSLISLIHCCRSKGIQKS